MNSEIPENRKDLLSRYSHDDVAVYRSSGEWASSTIVDAVERAFLDRRDVLALASAEGEMTFHQLWQRSDRFAAALSRLGLGVGDSAVFQMGNELETIVAWYGALKAGVRPVSSIPNHRLHEISHVSRATGARAHIFQSDYRSYDLADLSRSLIAEVPSIEHRIVSRGTGDGALAMEELIESVPAQEARDFVATVQSSLKPEDIALFQLSGGTTGVPKVIPHTHSTYQSAAQRWARNLDWDRDIVTLHFLPIMHHAGLCTALLPAHLKGGCVVLSPSVDAELIEKLIARYGVQWLHFNLAAFEPLRGLAARRACNFSSITHFSWTFTRPEMSRAAEEFLGATVVGSFGMGEGVHLSARRQDTDEIRRFTVGSLIGEHDIVRVMEPETENELSDGEVGELCFGGPSVIRGYFRSDEVNRTSFTSDGLLRSGDLGRIQVMDGRRTVVIEGRLKDQISRGGEKFMAAELELLLMEHPEVVDVAAIGIPDVGLGERVGIVVVPARGVDVVEAEELRQELVRFLDERQVAKFKWPEYLHLIEQLPRTAINKVKKEELRDLISGVVETTRNEEKGRR